MRTTGSAHTPDTPTPCPEWIEGLNPAPVLPTPSCTVCQNGLGQAWGERRLAARRPVPLSKRMSARIPADSLENLCRRRPAQEPSAEG